MTHTFFDIIRMQLISNFSTNHNVLRMVFRVKIFRNQNDEEIETLFHIHPDWNLNSERE